MVSLERAVVMERAEKEEHMLVVLSKGAEVDVVPKENVEGI